MHPPIPHPAALMAPFAGRWPAKGDIRAAGWGDGGMGAFVLRTERYHHTYGTRATPMDHPSGHWCGTSDLQLGDNGGHRHCTVPDHYGVVQGRQRVVPRLPHTCTGGCNVPKGAHHMFGAPVPPTTNTAWYACIYVCVYLAACLAACLHVFVYVYRSVHACMYVYACAHACLSVGMCVCVWM